MRSKLEHVERSTGKRPPALDSGAIPPAAQEAFDSWVDIHAGRTQGGFGPSPLSWTDLASWAQVRGIDLPLPHSEMELIRVIDQAFLRVAVREDKK